MKTLAIAITSILASTITSSPEADMPVSMGSRNSECAFGQPAILASSIRELPDTVGSELQRFFEPVGGMADAEQAFNSTDQAVYRAAPQRRFIRAYFVRDVWLVWYEHGGFAYHLQMLALTRQPARSGNQHVFRAAPGSSFTGDLCAASKAFLAGVRAAPDL